MKITKRQLRRLIKEEAADCVKDMMAMGYSRSQAYRECDDDDDDYSYRPSRPSYRSSYRPSYRSRRKTTHVGTDANAAKIAAVEKAIALKSNNFLSSILKQKILQKSSPEDASLFESLLKKGEGTMKITKRQLRRVIREAMDAQLNRPFSQPDRNVEAHPEAVQLWDNVIGKNLERRGMNRQDFLDDWNEFVKFLTKFTMNSKPRLAGQHLTPAEASEEIGSRIMQKILRDKRFETSDTAGRRQIYVDATIKTLAEILRAMNYVPDREEDLQVNLDLR
jgi:hypothetical protein